MGTEIIVGLLSLCGTAIGSLGGIVATQKLTTFRLERLEEKVDKHNNVIERTFKLETEVEAIKEDLKEIKSHE